VKAFLQAPVLLVIKHQEPETSGDQTVTKSLFCFFKNTKCNRIIAASDMKKTEPVLVAFREAAEPDDVPVVQADQQMHLQVQVILPLSALARVRPSDRRDEAVDEAGPVYRAAPSRGYLGVVLPALSLPPPQIDHKSDQMEDTGDQIEQTGNQINNRSNNGNLTEHTSHHEPLHGQFRAGMQQDDEVMGGKDEEDEDEHGQYLF
jgi:hypothetical protein